VLAEATGTTPITLEISEATVSITPPSAVTLGNASAGEMIGSSAVPGEVIVTPGTAGYPVAYAVTASDANLGAGRGFMMNGNQPLSGTNKFFISGNMTGFAPSDAGITYTGIATGDNATNLLPFYVKQRVDGTEVPGQYSIAIRFTASLP
jgi:hypothetical protein